MVDEAIEDAMHNATVNGQTRIEFTLNNGRYCLHELCYTQEYKPPRIDQASMRVGHDLTAGWDS